MEKLIYKEKGLTNYNYCVRCGRKAFISMRYCDYHLKTLEEEIYMEIIDKREDLFKILDKRWRNRNRKDIRQYIIGRK